MKIALGSDHGGYALKCDIIQLLEKLGHEYKDFGCYSTESANMLAIGAGFTGKNLAERMVEVFLSTDFEGGRHERRVNKLNAIQP